MRARICLICGDTYSSINDIILDSYIFNVAQRPSG